MNCSCHQNAHSSTGCSCHNDSYSTSIVGTTGSDVVASDNISIQSAGGGKTVSQLTTGDKLYSTFISSLKTACTKELSRRSQSAVSWASTGAGVKITASLANQIRNAIVTCGGNVSSVSYGGKITYSWFISSAVGQLSSLQNTCVCFCYYCTCQCDYCNCYCNYCTCKCNYCYNCGYCSDCYNCGEGG